MNRFYNKKTFYIVIAIFIAWLFISAYWYTCGLKNLCQNTASNEIKKSYIDNSKKEEENEYKEKSNINKIKLKNKIVEKKITCSPYLKESIIYGRTNNINEVAKLEKFLNDSEKENLKIDGRYLKEDMEAVKRFQKKYNNPDKNLGQVIEKIDGIVGPETLKKINIIYCINKSKEYLNKSS